MPRPLSDEELFTLLERAIEGDPHAGHRLAARLSEQIGVSSGIVFDPITRSFLMSQAAADVWTAERRRHLN